MSLCQEKEKGEGKEVYKIDEVDIYTRELEGCMPNKDQKVSWEQGKAANVSILSCIYSNSHCEAGIFFSQILCIKSSHLMFRLSD